MRRLYFLWIVVLALSWSGRTLPARESIPATAMGVGLRTQAVDLAMQGKFSDAARKLGKAIELNPKDPLAQKAAELLRAYQTFEKKRQQKRREDYEKALTEIRKLADKKEWVETLGALLKAHQLKAEDVKWKDLPWVDDIARSLRDEAEKLSREDEWARAYWIYSRLNEIFKNPDDRARSKFHLRRAMILALYQPPEGWPEKKEKTPSSGKKDKKIKGDSISKAVLPLTPDEGSEWKIRTKGVTAKALNMAFRHIANDYVDRINYRKMINHAVLAVQPLGELEPLVQVFKELKNRPLAKRFSADCGKILQEFARRSKVRRSDLQECLTKIISLNNNRLGLPEPVIVEMFSTGALSALDPYTTMIWPSELKEFHKQTAGEFSGVGITITIENGKLMVISPLEGYPAFKAGIQAGDAIIKINGRSAKGITIGRAVRTITGPTGTKVTLTVLHPDKTEPVDISITRTRIVIKTVKGWKRTDKHDWTYTIDPEAKIGYIRVSQFSPKTIRELIKAVESMKRKGLRGLILDLRFNPGGLLRSCVEAADMFLDRGVIVSTRGWRSQPQRWVARSKHILPNWPIIVLVNQYSASASEILSGALKDNARAVIVGTRTFGKGSVQRTFRLSGSDAELKLTCSYYYLPSGRKLHRREGAEDWGVRPQIEVRLTGREFRDLRLGRLNREIIRPAPDKPTGPAAKPADDAKDKKTKDEAPSIREIIAKPLKKLRIDPQLATALVLLRIQLLTKQPA